MDLHEVTETLPVDPGQEYRRRVRHGEPANVLIFCACVAGTFQVNHVRLDRMYDYLLCRGGRAQSLRIGPISSRQRIVLQSTWRAWTTSRLRPS